MQHEQDWLRELRVCHPDFFAKYFTMTIADNDLSQEALENLMRLADDHNKFIAACEALDQRGLLKLAFERLDAFKEKIPLEHMESLICALCDLSDKFPNRAPGLLEQDLNSYAWRIACFGLQREKDLHKRLVVLKSALASSTGLTLPFEIVSLNERSNKADESIVEQADLEVLKKICVEKLQNAAKVGCLRQNPRLKYLLFKWHEWGGKDEVRAWLAENMQSAKDAAWLLSILMEETHAYGRDHRILYNIKLGILEQFSDLDVLTRLLEQEKDAVYSKLESIAIRKFKDALKRRSEGKPDDACEHYSDEGELVE